MPHTILIVDDNEEIRRLLKMGLQFGGHTVREAEDGALGLAALQAGGIDMVISDIAMPNMNGLEMLAHIRADERFKSIPVLICSAEKDATQESMLARGATGILPKPCGMIELINTVKNILPAG